MANPQIEAIHKFPKRKNIYRPLQKCCIYFCPTAIMQTIAKNVILRCVKRENYLNKTVSHQPLSALHSYVSDIHANYVCARVRTCMCACVRVTATPWMSEEHKIILWYFWCYKYICVAILTVYFY